MTHDHGSVARAMVSQVNRDQCTLKLVDHGQFVTVVRQSIVPLTNIDLAKVAAFCVPVAIAGLEPAGSRGGWTIEATVCLSKILAKAKVLIQMVGGKDWITGDWEDGAEKKANLWLEEETRENPTGMENRIWKSVSHKLQLEGMALSAGFRSDILDFFADQD